MGEGPARFAGIRELQPPTDEELARLGVVPEQSPDPGELLDRTGAEIAVVRTPIHTHGELGVMWWTACWPTPWRTPSPPPCASRVPTGPRRSRRSTSSSTGLPTLTSRYGRTDLLANLVAHLRDGAPLLVPLERTGAFTRLVETVRTAPDPAELPCSAWMVAEGPRGPRRPDRRGRPPPGAPLRAWRALGLFPRAAAPRLTTHPPTHPPAGAAA
ncbi:hypothetical protein DEH69_24055 [Streptomyces sp. PT12]|nr:hypothetical protein DEH69_24055 [Streptomyces sp. PT12]